MEVKFKRLEHGAAIPLPSYGSQEAAGMDLCAAVDEDFILEGGRHTLVPTGFSVAIPEGFEGQVRPRSGLAAKSMITVLNTPGTIDSDYRGEIKVILMNHGRTQFRIRRGDRIAQMVISPVTRAAIVLVDELSDTERGEGGFGSTGI